MQEVAVICSEENDTTAFVDINSGAQLYTFRSNACTSAHGSAFCRQHNLLISAQKNKDALHVYSVLKDTPRVHHTAERVSCVAVSEDGAYLVAGTQQGNIMIWMLNNGDLLRLFPAHYRSVSQVLLTLDTSFLVSASTDSTLKVWNMADVLDVTQQSSSSPPCRVLSDHHLAVTSVTRTLRQEWVLTCSLDMTIKIMDIFHGNVIYTRALPCPLHVVACNSVSTEIYAGGSDGKIYGVRLYENRAFSGFEGAASVAPTTHTTASEFIEYEGHSGAVTGLAVPSSDHILLSSAEDGKVHVWDAASGQLLRALLASKARVASLQVVLLPTLLPTEKALSLWEPLGANLKKYPRTEFETLAVRVRKPALQQAQLTASSDSGGGAPLLLRAVTRSSSSGIRGQRENLLQQQQQQLEQLQLQLVSLQAENSRLLCLNNKLYDLYVTQR